MASWQWESLPGNSKRPHCADHESCLPLGFGVGYAVYWVINEDGLIRFAIARKDILCPSLLLLRHLLIPHRAIPKAALTVNYIVNGNVVGMTALKDGV